MSHLNTAIKIFGKLLDKGQLDRETDGDLFLEFRNSEVRSILAEFEEEMDFRIVEASSAIYLDTDSGNSLLGFITRDFREWVASDARLVDAYLLCYISMFILYLFYGSRNKNPKQREFLGSAVNENWTGALPWPWKIKRSGNRAGGKVRHQFY